MMIGVCIGKVDFSFSFSFSCSRSRVLVSSGGELSSVFCISSSSNTEFLLVKFQLGSVFAAAAPGAGAVPTARIVRHASVAVSLVTRPSSCHPAVPRSV